MFFDGEAMRISAGPTKEETHDEIQSRAEKLLRAYEKNVASLLEDRGLQHGAPDPKGHMHYAQQMLRVLKTVTDPQIDPHHWPKNFDLSHIAQIPVVFLDENKTPVVKDIQKRDFDNPKKLIEAVEEILVVAQIDGL